MPRGSRSIESRIAALEAQKAQYQSKIDGYKSKIADLNSKLEALKESEKQKKLENLLEVIQASGKTPEEILSALKTENK